MPSLLSQADHALYYAKARGRNRVEVSSGELTRERAMPAVKPAQAQSAA
jgi:hypothetical protein